VVSLSFLRGLGVVKYSVRIAVDVRSDELIEAPRFLLRRRANGHAGFLPIEVKGVDLRNRTEIESNSDRMKRAVDNAVEK
jgi:hypothetical protein